MQAITTAIDFGEGARRDAIDRALTRPGVRQIRVFGTLDDAAGAWTALQAIAPCSPYQQFTWAEAWCGSVGEARRRRPVIAVAYDRGDRPIALFPFERHVTFGLRIASFVGGRDSNSNLALFADPAAWDGLALRAALATIAADAEIDLFALQNQPKAWQGRVNPFARLRGQESPSGIAVRDLRAERPLSKPARKKLRQKTGWLEARGPLEFRRATDSGEVERLLAAHLAHRSGRAGVVGVAPPSAQQLAFYRQAAAPSCPRSAALELYALHCGSDIVATFGGTPFQGRYSGMILSMDPRPEVARCSPGELLLRRIVAELPARGFDSFDLGIGEARYKGAFCEAYDPLFDCFVPIRHLGRAAAPAFSAALHAKRWAKRSPVSMALRRRVGLLTRHFASS